VDENIERFRSGLLAWGEENVRRFPWRESDASLYEVFVAEFFLTQTPATNVAKVYPSFVERYPNLDSLRRASEEELVEIIRPLGFYNQRAEALVEIANSVDTLPTEPAELRKLPQVGSYVAEASLCFAESEPYPIVDKNVRRVYGRVFANEWPTSDSEQRDFAHRLLPETRARSYNMALLDFGALVCTPRSPNCENCFASNYCTYYNDVQE
jgi:A/G-specific adenine glycosylase